MFLPSWSGCRQQPVYARGILAGTTHCLPTRLSTMVCVGNVSARPLLGNGSVIVIRSSVAVVSGSTMFGRFLYKVAVLLKQPRVELTTCSHNHSHDRILSIYDSIIVSATCAFDLWRSFRLCVCVCVCVCVCACCELVAWIDNEG